MNIKLILKGFIIGIAKIIPGVSGALLAISLGVYDKGLDAITNFFNNKKKNTIFLLNLAIGIFLSIIIFSKLISYTLINYYLPTMLLFIGLICGGIFPLFKKVKRSINSFILIITSFLLILFLSLTNINNNYLIKDNIIDYIVFFFGGILDAIGTVVPGVSGTALLMISGLYNNIINVISNLDNFKILISFGLGIVIGIILIAKIMNYLLKKYNEKTYCFILGISLGSIIILIIKTFIIKIKIPELIIGVPLFILGIYISNKLDN